MSASTATRRSTLPRSPQRHSALGGTLIGVFIGIVVGLGLAATVAYWLMKNNPALPLPSLSRGGAETAKDAPPRSAQSDTGKPRFDFYKILPGATDDGKAQPERRQADRGDRPVADQAKERSADKAAARPPVVVAETPPARAADKPSPVDVGKAPKPADRYWLQAGSFSASPDAESLRARLAMAGWEATVQEGALPDKSVRYRVRLGPFDNSEELGRTKTELAKRGFDASVIHY